MMQKVAGFFCWKEISVAVALTGISFVLHENHIYY